MTLVQTPAGELGWPAADFSLPGVDGADHTMQGVRGEHGTVVMFICNHCPYVKAQLREIVREASDLAGLGVGTIAIMPNDTVAYPADSFDKMRSLAQDCGFSFPYVLDNSQDVARAYGAVCTPDFYGFDSRLNLVYRGRLTELRNLRVVPGAKRELFDAMVLVAAGQAPSPAQQPSIGCSIKWKH